MNLYKPLIINKINLDLDKLDDIQLKVFQLKC